MSVGTDEPDRKTVSRILRVNHAGEKGAIYIYRAQIALAPRDAALRAFLAETLVHERAHLERFRSLMPARGTQPCGALALWWIGGGILGAATALMGKNAVLACTEAVERAVHRHLEDQLRYLADTDPELSRAIAEIQREEEGHLAYARDGQSNRGVGTRAVDVVVTCATEALIFASTYGASAKMARRLRA